MAQTSTLDVVASAPEKTASAGGRLVSLDIFRGATIALMILVNNPGDEEAAYWPLKHADWNGWTPTDPVFPFFLFIVGVAMVFSLSSRLERGASRRELMTHILRRGVILAVIGILLNGFPNHYQPATWRFYGVLQRIAICYVITAFLMLWAGRPKQLVAITGACLVGYWILMRYVPVPGLGVPTQAMPLLEPDRNLAAWLDRKLMMGHLYENTRDPEGLLSTIPSLATSLLGVLTGQWLRSQSSPRAKAAAMLAFGVVGLALGEFFNLWFPINKKLWTSSYVLFTAGLALVCLAICYWIADIKRWRGWWTKPFVVFGMNAIAAYVFAEIPAHWISRVSVHLSDGRSVLWKELIYQHSFEGLASPGFSSLLYALAYVAACLAAMWVLYRKRIFLKT